MASKTRSEFGSTAEGLPEELLRQRVFTTGEAAAITRISIKTIIRCFDNGRLGGFRIPGSKIRRVPKKELVKFMKANDIPVPRLLEPPVHVPVLLERRDQEVTSAGASDYQFCLVETAVELGELIATEAVAAVVVTTSMAERYQADLSTLRERHPAIPVVILASVTNSEDLANEVRRAAGALPR